jgi:tagatose-6-phosphate ketose/aldose isomerase
MNSDTHTWREIQQQPALWPMTAQRVREQVEKRQIWERLKNDRIVITGAGTSAYVASAIAAAWPRSIGIPSTDLLLSTEKSIEGANAMLSVGRSGDSPESMAVVERVHSLRPEIWHLAVTCNANGALATSPIIGAIVLDPRTNDKSLVMTSSFSNLLLAGLCLAKGERMESVAALAAVAAQTNLHLLNECMKNLANRTEDRVLFLASPPLFSWAQEGALKVLEMTGGRFTVMAETYLALRHGPMSFLRPNTQVICLLSNDNRNRSYEEDLVRELRTKKLGYLVGICNEDSRANGTKLYFDEVVPALLPQVPDDVRTPFEILAVQLLGYHLSLRVGLNPDNPSPNGVINRVAQGIQIYQ